MKKPIIASHLAFIHINTKSMYMAVQSKQTAFHGLHYFAVVFSFMYLVTNCHLYHVC